MRFAYDSLPSEKNGNIREKNDINNDHPIVILLDSCQFMTIRYYYIFFIAFYICMPSVICSYCILEWINFIFDGIL